MSLNGTRVAMIVANEFDEEEFKRPYEDLKRNGAEVTIIGVDAKQQLISHHRREEITTDESFDTVSARDFDGVVIPGGYSPDKLRLNQKAIEFLRKLHEAGKPIAAICHAPSLLISAGIVKGRTVTAWPSIMIDLKNAGANVVEAEVAIDGNLITSRNVSDLPVFIKAIVDMLEGRGRADAKKTA